jgi:hypothetical protein
MWYTNTLVTHGKNSFQLIILQTCVAIGGNPQFTSVSGAVVKNHCARVKDSYSNRYEYILAKPFDIRHLEFMINGRNFNLKDLACEQRYG